MTREWTQIGTHTLQRELRGVESIVNHSERTNDGNVSYANGSMDKLTYFLP